MDWWMHLQWGVEAGVVLAILIVILGLAMDAGGKS